MNYRTAKLLAETNFTTAQTKTIPINVRDIISRIVIGWRVTRDGHAMDSYPHSDISKIELLDGSEVLHSLSGGENQAVCIYDRKAKTMNHGQHLASNSEYSSYGIDFGRFLHDPLYAFDPTRFINPQLKVTFNHAVCDTGASSGNLEVWAEMFDERQVSPVGFLACRQIKDFTIATAGVYDYVELPVDRTLRALFIQGYQAAYEPWYQVIEARLDEDGDKRIPFDWDLEDYHRVRKGWDTPVIEQLVGRAESGGHAFYTTPTDYWAIFTGTSHSKDEALGHSGVGMKGGVVTLTAAAATQLGGLVYGWLPNHMFHFPFGDPQVPEDWYNLANVRKLKLRVKTGTATSGNIRTSVQQVRMY